MNRSNRETGLLKAVNDFPFQLIEVMVKQVFSYLSMIFPFQLTEVMVKQVFSKLSMIFPFN